MKLSRVQSNSSEKVFKILESSPIYQQNTQGAKIEKSAAIDLFQELPPKCSYEQKHVLLCEHPENNFIGVADIVFGFPNEETAFVGLLLLSEKFQGKGFGRSFYREAERYIKTVSNRIEKVRLAYVESNPVKEFWIKMGFNCTGEEKPYEGKKLKSKAILMEKTIK